MQQKDQSETMDDWDSWQERVKIQHTIRYQRPGVCSELGVMATNIQLPNLQRSRTRDLYLLAYQGQSIPINDFSICNMAIHEYLKRTYDVHKMFIHNIEAKSFYIDFSICPPPQHVRRP